MTSIATPAPGGIAGGRKILIAALVLGAVAAGLIVAFLASQQDTEKPSLVAGDTLEVVVATREIAVGTTLDASMVRLKELPRAGIISDPFTDTELVIGEVTRFPLQANEQVAVGRLVPTSGGNSISFHIPEGLRGFTIKVDQEASPAGLLAPGDFVDVLLAVELKFIEGQSGLVPIPDTEDELNAVVTVIQNVQVLAVQRDFVNTGGAYDETTRGPATEEKTVNHVTMAVTPEQAQLLWLAAQKGSLTLSLRGFGDTEVPELTPAAEPFRVN